LAAAGGSGANAVWSGRTLEWTILLAVLLVIIGSYGQQSIALQAQAEVASVQLTLGALRTSLVVDHLQKQARGFGADVVPLQRNPFKVLDALPVNYAGEVPMADLASVAPGSWVFDPECACIGYRPQNHYWEDSTANPVALWFRVSTPPGPLQLTALETYFWHGQAVN
jgi:hypothetical protein